MFAGIIEKTSRISGVEHRAGIRRVQIEQPRGWKLQLGQSVAVDGICSTVVATSAKSFDVEYMPETLSKTTAGDFANGRIVNLERSLTLNTFIDGHLVQGHIDAKAKIANIISKNGVHLLSIALPSQLKKFVAEHGSITINGVALTVATKNNSSSSFSCTVALIPYTLKRTNLGELKKGDYVNIETDLIARYLAALK